jgi:hypothetical protein
MFGVGSLASDTAPAAQGPYLYQYAPMYTQDPTTVVNLPLNITDTSKYYYLDVIFPGTQATVTLSNVSTYVSLRPVGSYVSPSTNPWSQQGTSVYYNGGAVAIGGVTPSLLTETLTINGNTSFVGNVTVTSDASGSTYVNARRTPAGSLAVSNYVTGSVPLTTTTNLIQNYLSNAASIRSNTGTGTITQALYCPGTVNSGVNFTGAGSSVSLSSVSSNLFVEAWVNQSSSTGNQPIFTRALNSSTFDLSFILSSGAPLLTCWNSSGVASSPNASNASAITGWTHIAFSFVPATNALRVFTNGGMGGTTGAITGTLRSTASSNIYIGVDPGSNFSGNVADVRVWSGGIVPVATFASPAAAPFGSTQPAYITGSPTLLMSLNSQYFPGASTSPYGPCLTLPGTVGSYYLQTGSPLGQNWKTYGFTLEGWINYPTFASSNTFQTGPLPSTIMQVAGTVYYDWSFGATTTGQLVFWFNGGGTYYAIASPANSLVTGQWAHIAVQTTSTALSLYINGIIQTLTQYNVTGGTSTASAYPAGFVPQLNAVGIGLNNGYYGYNNNFAIAKARMVYGTASQVGNVYSMAGFTPNPNLGAVPAGGTVAWSLESQYPLPTYPSIQDVTQLPAQTSSFGSLPTPVGGVTSNVLGPFSTTYPQLDSIRFDGTGYIDYGNAASSVVNSNLWASPWTIEGWVYPTNLTANYPNMISRSNASTSDWYFNLAQTTGIVGFKSGTVTGSSTDNVGTLAAPINTWTHVAATYDGTRSNVYVGGALSNSMVASAMLQTFTPTLGTAVGYTAGQYFYGNLADLRVSNVARYTGSSYTVPSAPFSTDSSTLLLLKSLGGQVGTTLEVQGRGLGAVSLGATRSVQSYPPAPMSSYLLDTTGNTFVTYGQGKYVASASSEYINNPVYAYAWQAFDRTNGYGPGIWGSASIYASSGGTYTGSVVTVDTLGNSYTGEWLQIQLPVSILLSSYSWTSQTNVSGTNPSTLVVLGSRDSTNWTLVNYQVGISTWVAAAAITFQVSATQAYNYYRFCIPKLVGGYTTAGCGELVLNGTEESLCVTSDSKVGVGIANPQRSLEVAGDLVVGGTISGGAGMGMFRNRIINGDMRFAQRGTSAVVANGVNNSYGSIDRWRTSANWTSGQITVTRQTLTASDNPYQMGLQYSLRCTVNSGLTTFNYFYINQALELVNIADFNLGTPFGSPFTVSFWFRSNIPAGSTISAAVQTYVAPGNISYVTDFKTTGTWQYVTFTVPPMTTTLGVLSTDNFLLAIGSLNVTAGYITPSSNLNTWASGINSLGSYAMYNWWNNAGNYIEFTGVQLEKGTVATPFEFRPYATELALCQRYFIRLVGLTDVYHVFGMGMATTATTAWIFVRLPVNMRTSPTFASNTSSSYILTIGGPSFPVVTALSVIANDSSGVEAVRLDATVASGMTSGGAVLLRANNTLYGYLDFIAEL